MSFIARARAVRTASQPCPTATPRIVALSAATALVVQNSAVCVCAAERTVLVRDPYASFWFWSGELRAVFSAGGGRGRNCAGVWMRNGRICATQGVCGVWNAGAVLSVGRIHAPGPLRMYLGTGRGLSPRTPLWARPPVGTREPTGGLSLGLPSPP